MGEGEGVRAETASPGLPAPSRGHSPGLRPPPTVPQRPLTRFLNSAEQQFPGMLFSRGTVLLMISPVLSLPGQVREGLIPTGPGAAGA